MVDNFGICTVETVHAPSLQWEGTRVHPAFLPSQPFSPNGLIRERNGFSYMLCARMLAGR